MSWLKKPTVLKGRSVGGCAIKVQQETVISQGYLSRPVSAMVGARPRSGTDPDTCLEVFRSHWLQAITIMNKTNGAPASIRRGGLAEEVSAVRQHIDQMAMLLLEEEGAGTSGDAGQGPVLQYTLQEDVLAKLLTWASRTGEHSTAMRLHQLKMYELLISQANQRLLVHKPVMRPLLSLLAACSGQSNSDTQTHGQLILLLHQLCVCVTQDPALLELLFNASADHGPAKFLMFSLLIPYVHHEGSVGQQARDALLLIMALSSQHTHIGQYVSQHSDFCPVLATGLSGLYSSLPRKWPVPADDWYQISEEDVQATPDLAMFLNSLEFCNAVVQVAHPVVRDQLLNFIYNGFLVPVIGPALHQDISKLPSSIVECYFGSSTDEIITATAYLDLFIRRISEPTLMNTFLRFILTQEYDDTCILDTLISRINTSSRLCMVSLCLFRTLVDLNCEDVMYQLVYKYLLPCSHVMVSQRRCVRDVDLYARTADKLLSLTPVCCLPDATSESPAISRTNSIAEMPASNNSRSSSPDVAGLGAGIPTSAGFGTKLEHFETSYIEYLESARKQIGNCTAACRCWSASYDGDEPSAEQALPVTGETAICDDLSSPDHETGPGIGLVNFPHSSTPKKPRSCTGETHRSAFQDIHKQAAHCSHISSNDDNVGTPSGSGKYSELQGHSPSLEITVLTGDSGSGDSGNSDFKPCPKFSSDEKSSPKTSPRDETDVRGTCVRDSYAESVVSEADSALSGSSCATDNAGSSGDAADSRSDSPLNDNFQTQEFAAFLLNLKRVKTPVEICDNIEDSFTEMDSLLEEVKQAYPAMLCRERGQTCKSDSPLPDFTACPNSTCPPTIVRPKPTVQSSGSNNSPLPGKSASWNSPLEERLSEFDTDNSVQRTLVNLPRCSSLVSGRPGSVGSDIDISRCGSFTSSLPRPNSNPHRYSFNSPNIGSFLTSLLSKLETMMANSLYVNLLLTGLLARLACYPQPLLRSFLLNHTLVFQPTVKSLVQVLGSVKHKVDCYSYTVKDFEMLLLRAWRFLSWREGTLRTDDRKRSDSNISLPSATQLRHGQEKDAPKKRGGSMIGDFFRRNSPGSKKGHLQTINDGYKFINRGQNSEPRNDERGLESVKTKNAVYCALVLEEFLKELAAICQEHAVLAATPNMDNFMRKPLPS